jgi:uncharacterized protein (TIGR02270 family)
MIVPAILQQHVDDAAWLASSRMKLTRAPHPRLERILQFDRRLLAHLDGLTLAGEAGVALRETALESPSAGAVFAVSVSALEHRDASRLDRSIALAQAVPSVREGLSSAFGWVERSRLQGTVADLLADRDGFRRGLGIAACAMHRVDPGLAAGRLVRQDDPAVRARALRTAGQLGSTDLRAACVSAAREDSDPEAQFWSTWAAVLLGDRAVALDLLMARGFVDGGAHRARAFRLALQAVGTSAAHAALQKLAGDPAQKRRVIEGSGIAGDPAYVPWLIHHMTKPATARLAGEAFSLITGAHLGASALDRPAPIDLDTGPNDNPDYPDLATDPDGELAWPDAGRIEAWWAAHGSRFQKGARYFMGAPLTRAHCIDVLRNGCQRQRILAAHYLTLLDPGTPLFNTSAPAWRQRRELAALT